jgi:hypothetical protein
MAHGIKVVKPRTSIESDIPSNVTFDSREQGAMKIVKKIVVEECARDLTTVFANLGGVKQGTYVYHHQLGYAPAFLMFEIERYNNQPPIAKMLPDFGATFAPAYINAVSTPNEIIVSNLHGDSGEFGRQYFLILYVFAEDLDAEV